MTIMRIGNILIPLQTMTTIRLCACILVCLSPVSISTSNLWIAPVPYLWFTATRTTTAICTIRHCTASIRRQGWNLMKAKSIRTILTMMIYKESCLTSKRATSNLINTQSIKNHMLSGPFSAKRKYQRQYLRRWQRIWWSMRKSKETSFS